MITLDRLDTGFDWDAIFQRVKVAFGAALVFGIGYWADGINHQTVKQPELERKAALLQKVETVTIPKLADAAGCQTARARISESLANKSEAGANIDLSQIPDCPLAPHIRK